MTDSQKRAITILSLCSEGLTAKEFARKWFSDDHDIWKRVSNQGNGACSGKGAWLWAGAYLCKLMKMGLVRRKSFNEISVFVATASSIDKLQRISAND